MTLRATGNRALPPHLAPGLLLMLGAWTLAWVGPRPYSNYTFFPLWFGYILTVDGMTTVRSGTSLLTRSWRRFALLFAFSIPLWWLFEFANSFLQNWNYVGASHFSRPAYVLLASLSFSTVMPAIFVTATFYRTFNLFSSPRRWIRLDPSPTGLLSIAALGLLLFVGSLTFPGILFPFVWIGLFLFLDVLNKLFGAKSIAAQISHGRWDTVLVLFLAGITCGIFWETWNYWSSPGWTYDVPFVPHPKIFEMPLLGYGGYLPFALEVYAAYHLFHTILFQEPDTYLTFDDE